MFGKKIKEIISRPLSKRTKHPTIEFESLMKRAKIFANSGCQEGLEDLQRLIMRPIQSIHIVDAYLRDDHGGIASFHELNDIGLTFIPSANTSLIEFLSDRHIVDKNLPVAKLGRDIVLPTCWSPSSIQILGNIGDNRVMGPWKQDYNHILDYWYPLNIFWVGGGNHSIAQGVILAEGEVTAKFGYDLTDLYRYVKFDGANWVDMHSSKTIGNPRYKELGYLYEIGRLLCGLNNG